MTGKHFGSLDGMRGILACAVMLMHYGLNNTIQSLSRGLLKGGLWELSVDFFFILSGFVLCRSFTQKPPSPASYAEKRLRRLAPMFLLSLALMLALGAAYTGSELVTNLLIVQTFAGEKSINFPAWSIPLELFLPAVGLVGAPLIMRSRGAVIPVLGAFIIGGAVLSYLLATGSDWRVLRGVAGLGTGFVLYRAWTLWAPSWGGIVATVLFGGTIVLALLAKTFPAAALLFYPAAALAMFTGATAGGVLTSAPIQMLGRWSYSIYLLHIPVLVACQGLLGDGVTGKNPLLKVALALVTITLAAACYRFVELPAMTKRQRLSPATVP